MTSPAEGDAITPDPPSLAIVIPAFNEALRLDAGFRRLQRAIAQQAFSPESTEFVIVDDGSTDNTSARAKELFGAFPRVSFIRLPTNMGKGAAVRAGIGVTTAPVVAFADADMAIDPIQMPKFAMALEHADIAIGSRAAKGASVDRPSLKRSAMNRVFNRFVNQVTHLRLADTQCGFKAFRGSVARLLFHFLHTERMAFDVEVLSLARALGLTVTEVPVNWSRVEGTRVRSLRDGVSMVRDVMAAHGRSMNSSTVLAAGLTMHSETSSEAMTQLQQLASVVPVVPTGSTEYLVLFPFQTDAVAQTRATGIGTHLGATVTPTRPLGLGELLELAPWRMSWEDRAISIKRA